MLQGSTFAVARLFPGHRHRRSPSPRRSGCVLRLKGDRNASFALTRGCREFPRRPCRILSAMASPASTGSGIAACCPRLSRIRISPACQSMSSSRMAMISRRAGHRRQHRMVAAGYGTFAGAPGSVPPARRPPFPLPRARSTAMPYARTTASRTAICSTAFSESNPPKRHSRRDAAIPNRVDAIGVSEHSEDSPV